MKSTTLLVMGVGASWLQTTDFRLRDGGVLDRQVGASAPPTPRTGIVADPRIPEEPERQVGIGRAIAALAVRDHFAVRRDAGVFVHLAQLVGGLERPIARDVARPLDVDGTWDRAPAGRANSGPAVF